MGRSCGAPAACAILTRVLWSWQERISARCYVCFREFATVYLMMIFPKNEKANLAAIERAYFQRWIALLRRSLEEG